MREAPHRTEWKHLYAFVLARQHVCPRSHVCCLLGQASSWGAHQSVDFLTQICSYGDGRCLSGLTGRCDVPVPPWALADVTARNGRNVCWPEMEGTFLGVPSGASILCCN